VPGVNPAITRVPLSVMHEVEFVGVTPLITGIGFTTTFTVSTADVHPLTVILTP
jgi:hypothetical protein